MNYAPTGLLKGNRYVLLEKIGEGGMGAVYRVADRLNGMVLALKQVALFADKLIFDTASSDSTPQIALANEFKILSSLRHPNIVSVLDYGFDAQQPYFTMDLLEKPRRLTEAAADQPQTAKIELIMQMLAALAYLHQRGVLHRDLKPANVLVTPDGQVKVLDFGLALSVADQSNKGSESISGTLGYIAPEILQGAPATIASDLYAIGIIAYEMLAGRHPFDITTNLAKLLQDIQFTPPNLSMFEPPLADVIGRLTAKAPEGRYADVKAVIQAISIATGYKQPVETLAIRDSFIQAASFVGRGEQMAQLMALMASAVEGHGQLCLIAGESGVGKSRLVNELRVRALVEDVLVLRGQAAAEGSSPYRVWKSVLRWLSILTPLSPLESSVLKSVVPDIDLLVGYSVIAASELAPQAERERFESTVVSILERQERPLLLLLEDLHWAGDESLALIQRLHVLAADHKLFVVGSYRDDETPTLFAKIPAAQRIKLERFGSEQIADLSASILGTAGRDPQLVTFLGRETEGNVFFITEVVRALAESAGTLTAVGARPLPETVSSGGIIAILKGRLDRVPVSARALLRLAAVNGRAIDLQLLAYLAPSVDLTQWLLRCANVAVLEVDESQWRFAHDKLREQILRDLKTDVDQWRTLHRQIAEAIETLHPDDSNHVAALAHYWTQADVPDKAVYYNELAAQNAAHSANPQAISFIQTAIAFDDRMTAITAVQQASRYSIMGLAQYYNGNFQVAIDTLKKALAYMDVPIPSANLLRLVLGVFNQIGIQFWHRIQPQRYIGKKDGRWVTSYMAEAILTLPFLYQVRNDFPKALYGSLVAMNFLEVFRLSASTNPILSYGSLHIAFAVMGQLSLARYYRRLMTDQFDLSAKSRQITPYQNTASRGQSSIYHYIMADWASVLTTLQESIPQMEASGEVHDAELAHYILGLVLQWLGRSAEAQTNLSDAYIKSRKRADRELQFLNFAAQTALLLRLGQLTEDRLIDFALLTDSAAASKLFAAPYVSNPSNQALYLAVQSAYYVDTGDLRAAWQALSQVLPIVNKAGLDRNLSAFDLYDIGAETCRRLLAATPNPFSASEKTAIRQLWQKLVKLLAGYAKVYVLARPAAALHQGWLDADQPRPAKARAAWEKSLALAQQATMPYFEGLAHSALAGIETLPTEARH